MLQPGKKFDFNHLFIFEMANNHQGSVDHGIGIIRAMADIARQKAIRGAVKLQFRNLDTLIHPHYRESKDNKHISRFLSTRLTEAQFGMLVEETKREGLVSIATPFDESSVEMLERLHVEVLKIGSCSAQDWPLLERAAETGKPVICSIGGLTIEEIDRVVSFFQHRGVDFALMHCVALYPTPTDKFHLNQIELMHMRYPGVTIGFSTHEDPSSVHLIRVAYAKGARLFEKHVGISTAQFSLNAYSATPEQVVAWIDAYKETREVCGGEDKRIIDAQELADLHALKRGVYVRNEIRQGSAIGWNDVFFAMPLLPGQLTSGQFSAGLIADRMYREFEPLAAALIPSTLSKREIIYTTIHAVKGMLNGARIPIGHEFLVELSHHYGLENLDRVGCVIIECVNREYAKKIIVQLPGQWNPVHYHKKKDETFQVLHGVVEMEVEGRTRVLHPGDTLWIPRGVWHSFGTSTGAVIEEISTTSHSDDSFYIDRAIAKKPRDERKTVLRNWGRHQFDNKGE